MYSLNVWISQTTPKWEIGRGGFDNTANQNQLLSFVAYARNSCSNLTTNLILFYGKFDF